jgi:hypothetical protein
VYSFSTSFSIRVQNSPELLLTESEDVLLLKSGLIHNCITFCVRIFVNNEERAKQLMSADHVPRVTIELRLWNRDSREILRKSRGTTS